MLENGANGVRAAVHEGARVRAIVLDAGLRVRAVRMRGAVMRQHASRSQWITRGARWTRATVGSVEIDAVGGRVTGLILALVDVQAVLGTGDESVTASGREGGGAAREHVRQVRSVRMADSAESRKRLLLSIGSNWDLPALVVDAHFVAFAADVGGTAGLARAVDAQLAGQTVTVAVADLHANAVLATLASRAIALIGTLTLAQPRDAQVLAGTVVRMLAHARHPNATLLRSGITVETNGTRAADRVIRATANCIRSANVFPAARICKGTRRSFFYFLITFVSLV